MRRSEEKRSAYFERFPTVGQHGSYCEFTAHGGWIIYGRSDAVLNPVACGLRQPTFISRLMRCPSELVELAVRNMVHDEAVKNRQAQANPDALTLFENRVELRRCAEVRRLQT